MVLQVGKGESKEKEFAEVNLPLPTDGADENPTVDYDVPPLHVKKKPMELCKILSLALNALLIIAVVLLAIKACTLKKELDDVKDRDEYEITARQANEHDSAIDLKGEIAKEGHEKIQQMMEDNDDDWYRNNRVKFFVCFTRRGRNNFWPW